ncbi:MAG: type II toxin-antitoxin system RelB/DinJ family antitoxin [Victivallales bacterium]|nr:type II toxin-antitoxin system RelB/DinJ family antitoxin [Victivallales bacterium]
MSTSTFSVRVDSVLKSEVEKCLSDMGMNMSTAINIYLRQIARIKAIPFIVTSAPLPNKETLEAIDEGERIAHDPMVRGYRDMESLRKALNS